jgi:1-deoxy-D-xylulose-5-phosphate reductoisomerase
VAVAAFLEGEIGFQGILRVIAETLQKVPHREPASIADVLDIDVNSRRVAREVIARKTAAFVPAAVPAQA